MPPKKKGKRKAKKVKIVPDPDAAYREYLEAGYYLPKTRREATDADRREVVRQAIKAFTTASTQNPIRNLLDSLHHNVPLSVSDVPNIIRAVDLSPTTDQLNQIGAMILEGNISDVPLNHTPAEQTAVDGSSEGKFLLVDKAKLESLLLELLRTRVLAYNPQYLKKPHPNFLNRVSSVVYGREEARVQACFEALWEACGSHYMHSDTEADVRYISVDDLKTLFEEKANQITETCFSESELKDFIFAFKGMEDNNIFEDVFLLTMLDV